MTLSMSTGQMRLPSRLYFCISFAPLDSASITRPSMKLADESLTTGVMVQLSCVCRGQLTCAASSAAC